MKKPKIPESAGSRSARLRRATRKARFRNVRRVRRASLRSARLAEAAQPERLARKSPPLPTPNPSQVKAAKRVEICLPEVLSLSDNFGPTVDAVNRLQTYVLVQRLPVLLDFRDVAEAELAAVLVLTAEIDRCRRLQGQSSVNGTYPTSRHVYDQLDTVGFFSLLGIRRMSGATPASDADTSVRVLPFRTGDDVNGAAIDEFLGALLDGVRDITDKARRDLYGCLIEAIKNATEHANKRPSAQQVLPKRWWMAGSARPADGECAIVVFDQGAGIPSTLAPNVVERVQRLMGRLSRPSSDSVMLRAATRIGRSSTAQQGRGKGFETMKKFVARSSQGELVVYSLRGRYRYASNGIALTDGRVSLGGTLVQWRMQHTSGTQQVAT